MAGLGAACLCAGLVSSRIWTSVKPKLRRAVLIERMVENSFALKLCGVSSMGIAIVAVLLIICLVVFFFL